MYSLDTEHWEFTLIPRYELKRKYKPVTSECTHCYGEGSVGGGLKSIDGPIFCSKCRGSGRITIYPETPDKPTIPVDFITHMRIAFLSYIHQKTKEEDGSEKSTVNPNDALTEPSNPPETITGKYQYY